MTFKQSSVFFKNINNAFSVEILKYLQKSFMPYICENGTVEMKITGTIMFAAKKLFNYTSKYRNLPRTKLCFLGIPT